MVLRIYPGPYSGNLASGGLIWGVPCEWTPAGGSLRLCGLCGFDTPKRCQGLTRPESLGRRRALALQKLLGRWQDRSLKGEKMHVRYDELNLEDFVNATKPL